MTTPENQITYVYGDTEVRKTGRYTEKKLPTGNKTVRLVEVTPANEADGFWRKFVGEALLLEIFSE